MGRYKVTLSYDGTSYSGWQIQPKAPSIQGKLRDALQTALQEEVYPVGAGRTDAGVHALHQVAHFDSEKEIDLEKALLSLNGLLPDDIRVNRIEKTTPDFHARYSSTLKEYHYHICTQPIVSPFRRLYTVQLRYRLDLEAIKEACNLFIGTHDFTTFGNVPRLGEGDKKPNPLRSIDRLDFIETDEGFRLEFQGPGFLYKMVRNITGCLIEVGRGKRSVASIPSLFEAKDRRAMGIAAPARGLFLVNVGFAPTTAL